MSLATQDAALLEELRERLKQPGLEFTRAPEKVSGGYDTDIIKFSLANGPESLSQPLVTRCFPIGSDPARVSFETAVQNALAGEGLPVPKVHLSVLGPVHAQSPFLVMDFVLGKTLLALEEPESSRLLGTTHAILHDHSTHEIERELVDQNIKNLYLTDLLNKVVEAGGMFSWASSLTDWLMANKPIEGVLSVSHGDFHKLNVMQDQGYVTGILDWSGFMLLEAAFDVANTHISFLILAKHLTAAGDFNPVDLDAVMAEYMQAYSSVRTLDVSNIPYYLVLRGTMILFLAAMKRAKPYQHPLVVNDVCELIKTHSGIELQPGEIVR